MPDQIEVPFLSATQQFELKKFATKVSGVCHEQLVQISVELYKHHLAGEASKRSLTPGWQVPLLSVDEVKTLAGIDEPGQ